MGTSGKNRLWANDDGMVNPTEQQPPAEETVQQSNVPEELPSQTKKPRTQEPVSKPQTDSQPIVVDHSGDGDTNDTAMPDSEPEAEAGPVSDMDWLRSKTSRLLGLLDEEEQADFEQRKVDEPVEAESPVEESRSAAIEQINSPEPQEATNTDHVAETPVTTPEQDTNIDNIKLSARLFVRNLAYDLRENDLQPLFSPYGKTEEVSTQFFFSVPNPPSPPAEVYYTPAGLLA